MKLYYIVQAAKRNKGLFHVQILGIYQMNDPFFFLDFQPFIEAFHKQRKYKCIVWKPPIIMKSYSVGSQMSGNNS